MPPPDSLHSHALGVISLADRGATLVPKIMWFSFEAPKEIGEKQQ
jgi:hypothetical protein